VPSWGVGTGGTRFARFPGRGEPRNVFEKMDDCGVINQLTRATPAVSLHFPWDKTSDVKELREQAMPRPRASTPSTRTPSRTSRARSRPTSSAA
jgi:L-rhamnose isomerase